MDTASDTSTVLLVIVGGVILAGLVARTLLYRLHLPAMASYILIGLVLSAFNGVFDFMTPRLSEGIGFLAQLGVVMLLFRVGLESDLDMLFQQLSNAALIWLPNILVPGVFAFTAIYLWPDQGIVAALFAGVAATATSIGVSTAVWEEAGRLRTPDGALLVDVAELDDLSAVILMSLLFVIARVVGDPGANGAWADAVTIAVLQLLKFAAFCIACYLFSRYIERKLTAWFQRRDRRFGPLLFATGSGVLIAAAADLLGFSLAIGALFAGLAFSRDPAERQIDWAFARIFILFSPFFFVAIGLAVDLTEIGGALALAAALFAAASIGKLIGAGLPAALLTTPHTGLVIGLSMIPRAEIFLIIMLHGLTQNAVSEQLYTAAVLVCLATSTLAPIAVRRLLSKQPRDTHTA
ncbi:MAG: cation:proton antiporter [Alphaproteobacteria bacterium]|nr:cation:proton antiporter [Alphaproteobacteria bacterium]